MARRDAPLLVGAWPTDSYAGETWQRRTHYGAVPVSAAIAANQQRVADVFYRQKLIPKAVNVAGSVWRWEAK